MTDQDTRRVKIAYDPANLKRNGSVVDVAAVEARQLVREGRAAYADGEDLYDSTDEAAQAAHVGAGRTKAELVEVAAAHGLDSTGTKAELVDRLTAAGVDPA